MSFHPAFFLALGAGLLKVAKSAQRSSRRAPRHDTLKSVLNRRPRRKPPEAGIAMPAVPPKGPLPKTGGAEAPLEFD